MKARLVLLIVWYGIVAAMLVTAKATAAEARLVSAPHLTQVVRQITAPGARVYCGYRRLGAAGEAWKEAQTIALASDVCSALRASRPITPDYPRVSTAFAVFVLAHEAGHLVTPGGEMAESQADCYATRTWARYARALGFVPSELAAQVSRETAGCWR